jgi:hypothetical protein
MVEEPPLVFPGSDASDSLLCDWFEFRAFFSPIRSAFLGEFLSQIEIEQDEEADDGELDLLLERFSDRITSTALRRQQILGDAYPFVLSETGDELKAFEDFSVGQAIYIFCLILEHSTKSKIIPPSSAPREDRMREARRHFEICATLAAAGHTRGPAFSTACSSSSEFLKKLLEVWEHSSDGRVRHDVHERVSTHFKDGGIDTIALWPERDRRPSQGILIGQAATGRDWNEKNIRGLKEVFLDWFEKRPAAEIRSALFVPFLIEDTDFEVATQRHGYVADRCRVPRLAAEAESLAAQGVQPIERLDQVHVIADWLKSHRGAVVGPLA